MKFSHFLQSQSSFYSLKKSLGSGYLALSTDRASNSIETGIRVVLKALSGLKIEEARRLNFPATNNEAKHEALIYGLGLAKHLGVKLLRVRSDSKLIAEQVARRFEEKEHPG